MDRRDELRRVGVVERPDVRLRLVEGFEVEVFRFVDELFRDEVVEVLRFVGDVLREELVDFLDDVERRVLRQFG